MWSWMRKGGRGGLLSMTMKVLRGGRETRRRNKTNTPRATAMTARSSSTPPTAHPQTTAATAMVSPGAPCWKKRPLARKRSRKKHSARSRR